jgi:NTP pyrophosphatase (non-canonical NTP hydrolase)
MSTDLSTSPIDKGISQHVFAAMTAWVHEVNVANGWHDVERPFSTDIALLHSEITEAYEAYRVDGMAASVEYAGTVVTRGSHLDYQNRQNGLIGKPLGVASELADELIRLFDTAERLEVDLVGEFIDKMRFNATRGYKHGGKVE